MKRKIILKNKKRTIFIAEKRIDILFNLARDALNTGDIEFARNCVSNMQKISSKCKISLKKYNWFFCKNCSMPYSLKTLKTSINKKTHTIDILCKNCKNIKRKSLKIK